MSFLLLLAVGALAVVALAKVRAAEREIARLGERVASLHDEIAILRAPKAPERATFGQARAPAPAAEWPALRPAEPPAAPSAPPPETPVEQPETPVAASEAAEVPDRIDRAIQRALSERRSAPVEPPPLPPQAATPSSPPQAAAPSSPAAQPWGPPPETPTPLRDAPEPAREESSGPSPRAAMPPVRVRTASKDVEQAFATRWAIWIGGIALAMGGLLMVRYSIEAGYFGPQARLAMGGAFAVALGVVAEILRRKETRIAVGALPAVDIPSVLLGAGVISGFGVVYAAHAVYEMIDTGPAFASMGAIGVGALLVSLVYGTPLGLIGLLGSYATPFLVAGTAPNYPALSIFVAVVTSVAFLVDARRPSPTLLGGAVVGHTAWSALIGLGKSEPLWCCALPLVGVALAAINAEIDERRERGRQSDFVLAAAFLAPLVLGGVLWVHRGEGTMFLAMLLALVAVNIVESVRLRALALLAPVAAAASIGFVLLWPTADGAVGITPRLLLDLLRLDIAPDVAPNLVYYAILFGALVAAPLTVALLARIRNGGGDPGSRACLAFSAALTPVAIALATSLRLNGFERTTGFAMIAAALAVVLAGLSEALFRTERAGGESPQDEPQLYMGSAAFAVGACIALGLAIGFALRETWLAVGFAVASAGVALVARARPIPLVRSMAGMLATAALMRMAWRPVIDNLGDTPVVNWLLVAYGLPTLLFGAGAAALSNRRDRAHSVLEAATAACLALFVAFEIVHAFVGADLRAAFSLFWNLHLDPSSVVQGKGVALLAVLAIAAALLAILFQELGELRDSPVYRASEKAASAVMLLIVALGLGVARNPLFNGLPVLDPPWINRFTWGYVGTGVALGLISVALGWRRRDSQLRALLQAMCVGLVALGATLILLHVFSGPDMRERTLGVAAYYQTVALVLLWQTLAAAVLLWRGAQASRTLEWSVIGLSGLAMLAGLRLATGNNPLFDGTSVEGAIVFNRILFGYGPVAVGFLALAWFSRTFKPLLAGVLALWGVAAAFLMAFLLTRHAFHGPTLFSPWLVAIAEAGVYACLALGAAWGATWLVAQRDDHVGRTLPPVAGVLAVALSAWMLGIAAVDGAPVVGSPVLNNTTMGLLAPTLIAALLSLWLRARGQGALVQRIYGLPAVIGGLVYALLQVRPFHEGLDLLHGWSDREATHYYGYSLTILVYGAALLFAGLRFAHRDMRLAALGVLAIAIFKVFLLDLANLGGLWRAASFIGLGASLIAIAYLYRWLAPADDE